jgi:hypothetical protein
MPVAVDLRSCCEGLAFCWEGPETSSENRDVLKMSSVVLFGITIGEQNVFNVKNVFGFFLIN